jgi:hypothetical protein
MIHSKLIYERSYDAYFNFGIYSTNEFELIGVLFIILKKFHLKYFYPDNLHKDRWSADFEKLNDLIKAYETKKNQNEKIEVTNQNRINKVYKKLLEAYNIGLDIDVLIGLLEDELKSKLKNFILYDTNKIMMNCSLIGFILTQTYYNSKLFEVHWKKAIEMNKEILILILEDDLNIDDELLKYKCLNVSEIIKKFSNKTDNFYEWRRSKNNPKNEQDFIDFIEKQVI